MFQQWWNVYFLMLAMKISAHMFDSIVFLGASKIYKFWQWHGDCYCQLLLLLLRKPWSCDVATAVRLDILKQWKLQYILLIQSHSIAFLFVSDLQILCWKYSVEWCFGKMCIFHHILQQVELGRLWQNWQVVPPTMDPSPPQTAISLQKKGLKGRHTEAITDNGAVMFFQAFLFPLLLFVWFQYFHSPICLRCLLSIPRCLWCPSVCGA